MILEGKSIGPQNHPKIQTPVIRIYLQVPSNGDLRILRREEVKRLQQSPYALAYTFDTGLQKSQRRRSRLAAKLTDRRNTSQVHRAEPEGCRFKRLLSSEESAESNQRRTAAAC